MLPATSVLRPDARQISPVSVVVVVLPLVPVTAMIGPSRNMAPTSISLITGMPRRSASTMTGASPGTPGLTTTRSAANTRALCAPN